MTFPANPSGPEGGTTAPESNAAPEGGTSDEFDFRQGYEELRPKFTQTTQQLSETQQRLSEYEQLFEALSDPESQAEVLAELGLQLDTGTPQGAAPEPDDEWEDPLEKDVKELREVTEELRSQREQEAEAQADAEMIELRDEFIGESITYIETSLKESNPQFKGFSQKAEEAIGNLAIAMESEEGIPDVQSAYNLLYGKEGLIEDERGNWIQTKGSAPQAPFGVSVPADKKPQTRAERVQYFDERLRASEQEF